MSNKCEQEQIRGERARVAIDDKKLLTVHDLCKYLSVSYETARRMLAAPDCPFVFRIGKTRYANKTILDKWIDNNTGR